jgi:hypothetical protein
MPPVVFEPNISADERPQTYALDRAATGTGKLFLILKFYKTIQNLVLFCGIFIIWCNEILTVKTFRWLCASTCTLSARAPASCPFCQHVDIH